MSMRTTDPRAFAWCGDASAWDTQLTDNGRWINCDIREFGTWREALDYALQAARATDTKSAAEALALTGNARRAARRARELPRRARPIITSQPELTEREVIGVERGA